jgi:hypothetical protein
VIQKILFLAIGFFFGLVLTRMTSEDRAMASLSLTEGDQPDFLQNKKWAYKSGPLSLLVNKEFPDLESVELFVQKNEEAQVASDFVATTVYFDEDRSRLSVSINLSDCSISVIESKGRKELLFIDPRANTFRDLNLDGTWDIVTKIKTNEIYIFSGGEHIAAKSLPQFSNGFYRVEAVNGRVMVFQEEKGSFEVEN